MAQDLSSTGPAAYGILAGYLLEEISPEAAAAAVSWLTTEPAEATGQQIESWANQLAEEHKLNVSESLVFGMQKLYILGERKLVDKAALGRLLDAVGAFILTITAESEHAELRTKMAAMRVSGATEASRPSVQRLGKVVAPSASPRSTMKAEKQLSLILERFGKPSKRKAQTEEAEALEAAQILTVAAKSSTSAAQFEELLSQIEKATGKKKGNVFATLGGGLPSWDLPIPEAGPNRQAPAQVEAMNKIIDLAESPEAALKRVRELVTAAVDKFNQGSIAAAMWMFDVAETGVKEKKVHAHAVERIRTEMVENLDGKQIRKYAENKAKHPALRLTLDFFPSMRLPALFQQLRGEPKAEKRRAYLGIIETHGSAARVMALRQLVAELKRQDIDTYYLRNLAYVVHRIPREDDGEIQALLVLLGRLCAKGQNIYVIKEAATALGQVKTEESVKILTTCLAEMEALLLRNDTSRYPLAEMQKTIDRVIGAIARIGTPGALLTVARHGLKTNPLLGDTRAQFAILAEQDLSFHTAVVDALVKALKAELPGKLLGRIMPKNQDSTLKLVEALSGTNADEVNEIFREIAERFPDAEMGKLAARVLAKRGKAPASETAEPTATLSGELAFFGLPTVLQSLGDMKATGVLTITTKEGTVAARIVVSDGLFLEAQKAKLKGADALFELLECPLPGKFAFVPYPPERMKSSATPQPLIPLIFEAVRRQDEFQLMSTVVPDDMSLKTTGVKPTAPEGEQDQALMRDVWTKAITGTPVGDWSGEVPADSYRIRRLLAHWVEAGSLAEAG